MVLGGNLEHYFRSSQYQASIRHQGLRGHLASSFLQLLSLSISSGGELEIEVRFRGLAPVFLFLHLYPSPSFLPFFPLSSLLSPSSYENLSVCVSHSIYSANVYSSGSFIHYSYTQRRI